MGNLVSNGGGGAAAAVMSMVWAKAPSLPARSRRGTAAIRTRGTPKGDRVVHVQPAGHQKNQNQTQNKQQVTNHHHHHKDHIEEENPNHMELLFEIDVLQLQVHRALSQGLVREIQTDAVRATIPHALNGRASKAQLVDRHQRILGKKENSKLFTELTHHVHLATKYCQLVQKDPAYGGRRQTRVPKVQELQHPAILRLYGHFMHNRTFHVLTEYCPRGNLASVLDQDEEYQKRHPEHRRLPMFHGAHELKESVRQLCVGVAFLHASGLAHTNLSLENVFVNDLGDLLLGDFKDAVFVGKENTRHALLPPPVRHAFAAPERHTHSSSDEADARLVDLQMADVWSTGLLIFMMATRQPLLHAASGLDPAFHDLKHLGFEAYYDKWKTHGLHPHHHPNRNELSLQIPEEIKSLLCEFLQIDPLKRWTVAQAMDQFEWLRRSHDELTKERQDGAEEPHRNRAPMEWKQAS